MDKYDPQSPKKGTSDSQGPATVTSLKERAALLKIPAEELAALPEELQQDLELLARLTSQIANLPDVDAARIVELHERIRRGDYEINARSLADKLSRFESDL